MTIALAAIGGAMGSVVRFLLGHYLPSPWHPGTLIANVVGSFVLGLLTGAALDGHAMALWGAGFCGGLTTYSSFAVQTVDMPRARALAYVCFTIGGCLAAAWLGLALDL